MAGGTSSPRSVAADHHQSDMAGCGPDVIRALPQTTRDQPPVMLRPGDALVKAIHSA